MTTTATGTENSVRHRVRAVWRRRELDVGDETAAENYMEYDLPLRAAIEVEKHDRGRQ